MASGPKDHMNKGFWAILSLKVTEQKLQTTILGLFN